MEGQKLGSRSRLGESRDPGSLTHSISHSLSHSLTLSLQRMHEQEQYADNSRFRHCQDGSSLEFYAATAGREFYIQDARGSGLWTLKMNMLTHKSSITNLRSD